MELREEVLNILKQKFGVEDAYTFLDFIETRVRTDVATQKDIYELKLEIERVRAELKTDIEKVQVNIIKWTFGFWITQFAVLVGILFKLLS
jgi:hypothetical protein